MADASCFPFKYTDKAIVTTMHILIEKSEGHQQAFSAAQENPYFYGNLCIPGNAESANEVTEPHLYLNHLKTLFRLQVYFTKFKQLT